jgi:hypothetical protein
MFDSYGVQCEETFDKTNNLIGCTAHDGIGDKQGFINCKKCEVKQGCKAKKVRD